MHLYRQGIAKEEVVSLHRSFGKAIRATKKRNVFKRFERVDLMKKRGLWDEKERKRVTGLPKIKE